MQIEAMPHLPDKEFTFRALDNWVHHMKHPNVHNLGKTFYRDIIHGHYTALILFVHNEDDPIIARFEQAAIENKSKKNIKHFVISDSSNKHSKLYRDVVDNLSIDESEYPLVVHATHMMGFKFRKYKYSGVVNKFNVLSFVDNVYHQRIPQYNRSQKSLSEKEQQDNMIKV